MPQKMLKRISFKLTEANKRALQLPVVADSFLVRWRIA
jgi:hypothetical protein